MTSKRIRTGSGRPVEQTAQLAFAEIRQRAEGALDAAATVWEAETKNLLRQPGRGRIYDKLIRMIRDVRTGGFRPWVVRTAEFPDGVPRPPHQASAPGDPPASDTGQLLGSIGWERIKALVRRLGSNARHALYLERGTTWMKPRPWIRQSVERALPKMRQAFRTVMAGRQG